MKNLPFLCYRYISYSPISKEMYFSWPKTLVFLYFVFFLAKNTNGQTSISGVINDYASVSAIDVSCNSVTVLNLTGFTVGGRVLLIQMKGASVANTNSATFGNISAIGNAGNYEFNEILTISGFVIYLKKTILKTYDAVGLQLITVPQYADVSIAGTLTATPWNGLIGGVLVFESSGIVTFNANINVEGHGFAGGARSINGTTTCSYGGTTYYSAFNSGGFGQKGEGISAYLLARESAQANQANAGGGGHSNNTGGGGGANYGKGGFGGNQANRPSGGSCNFFGIGARGMGGVALSANYSNAINKIFLGGGGGGGHQNNLLGAGPPGEPGATAGNPGGGLVIINALTIVGNGYTIYAAGYNSRALNASSLVGYGGGAKYAFGDSGGGGGGGGGVLISTGNYASSQLNVDVSGGRGDTVYTEIAINLGPGGGGGGGFLWVNNPVLDPNVLAKTTGGINGISWNTGEPTVCGCAFGSAAGDPGIVLTNLVLPENASVFTPCTTPVDLLSFKGEQINGKVILTWATASETNNNYFLLEKSTDGVNYDFLAKVNGNGNASSSNLYSFKDVTPVEGFNYYRLKQYDYNGTENFLGTIKVKQTGLGNIIEKIYPNPFTDELTIALSIAAGPAVASVKIINLLGEEVLAPVGRAEAGLLKLDLAQLAKGVYFIQVSTSEGVETRKIIKD